MFLENDIINYTYACNISNISKFIFIKNFILPMVEKKLIIFFLNKHLEKSLKIGNLKIF